MKLLPAAILAALMLIGLHPGARAVGSGHTVAQATPLKLFDDPIRGYTLRYPATWKLTADIPMPQDGNPDAVLGTRAMLLDPSEQDTGFAVLTRLGVHLDHFVEQSGRALHVNATMSGPIVLGSRIIGGVAFRSATVRARDKAGRPAIGIMLRGVHGYYTYNILIAMALDLPVTPRLKAEIDGKRHLHRNSVEGVSYCPHLDVRGTG